jgi:hypothetical protein
MLAPSTSSPLAKRVAFEIPVSSSSSDESEYVSQTLNTTLEDIELAQLEEIENNEEQELTLEIPITTKTHHHCLVCPNVTTTLREIPHELQLEFFIRNGIWISDD